MCKRWQEGGRREGGSAAGGGEGKLGEGVKGDMEDGEEEMEEKEGGVWARVVSAAVAEAWEVWGAAEVKGRTGTGRRCQ